MSEKETEKMPARPEVISINVTREMKSAMDRIVKEKSSKGEKWSINREAFARLQFTFDLTGTDGRRIEPLADGIIQHRMRERLAADLTKAITEASSADPFLGDPLDVMSSQEGRLRKRSALRKGMESDAQLIAQYFDDYIETEDLSRLSADNLRALEKLKFATDAPLSDDDLAEISTFNSERGIAILDNLAKSLAERIPDEETFQALSGVQRSRAIRRLFEEWSSVRECMIAHSLARYAIRWGQIKEDAITAAEPFANQLDPDSADYAAGVQELAKPAAKQLDKAHAALRKQLSSQHSLLVDTGALIERYAQPEDDIRIPLGPDDSPRPVPPMTILERLSAPSAT